MLLLSIHLLAALVIFIRGLFFAVNAMDRHTACSMRFAWIGMTVAALGILLDQLYGGWRQPSMHEVALSASVALYVAFERRRPGHIRGMP